MAGARPELELEIEFDLMGSELEFDLAGSELRMELILSVVGSTNN